MLFDNALNALAGGVLLGLSALMILLFNGKIAGVSGIFGGFLHLKPGDTVWRIAFLGGLITGGMMLLLLLPASMDVITHASILKIIIAGLLVGFGTRMASGCTSGHGICGLGRLSARSLVAVATFMTTAIITATILSPLMA